MKSRTSRWGLMLLGCVVACAATAQPDAGIDRPWIASVLSAFEAMAAADPWPSFAALSVPLLVYDGKDTWLIRHPKPPETFAASRDIAGLSTMAGLHPLIRAGGAVQLGGVWTAAVDLRHAPRRFPRAAASLVIHEAFHVFQRLHHPDWSADESKAFAFPADDAALCERRRLESMALARALSPGNETVRIGWIKAALKVRAERLAAMPKDAIDYERGTELYEGLATYVEQRALQEAGPLVLDLPPGDFRQRAYASGRALALLLDAVNRSWRQELNAKTHPLDELLDHAVAKKKPPPLELTDSDRKVASEFAAAEVKDFNAKRAAAKQLFLAATGWQIVIDSQKDPLQLGQFDALNLLALGDQEVLHRRLLSASNDEATIEITGHPVLTRGSGEHALFDGITRITVSGLTAEPKVLAVGKDISVKADGVNVKLTRATLERQGRKLLLTVVP